MVAFLCLLVCAEVQAQMVPLPSWNDGPAKKAILEFVQATTDQSSPKFVPPEARIATFDQDGTLWVEHPLYTQVLYCLERVPVLAAKKPELKNVEPFKTVLSGNREAMAKLTMPDLEKILAATLTGMPVEQFNAEVKHWLATAKHPRWDRPFTELTYLPMQKCCAICAATATRPTSSPGAGLRAPVLRADVRHPARAGGRHRRWDEVRL